MTSIRVDSNGMMRNETNFEFINSSTIFIDKINRNFKFQIGESVKIIEKASNVFQHGFNPKVSRQKYLIIRKGYKPSQNNSFIRVYYLNGINHMMYENELI